MSNHVPLYSLHGIQLCFRFRVIDSLHLPADKGSTFHGALGHALKHVAPLLWQPLFAPGTHDKNQALLRPFVLRPPPDTQRTYPSHSEMTCELVLLGTAINHLSLYICAMDRLGRYGIGKERHTLDLLSVEALHPTGTLHPLYTATEHSWSPLPPPVTGHDLLEAHPVTDSSTLHLHLCSRLRLQTHNRLVRHAPEFQVFFARLLGRLSMIAWFHHGFTLLEGNDKHSLLAQAADVQIASAQVRWDDWSRYSGRQHAWMTFGGLLGDIIYTGNLTPFIPYLVLGEWFHVGGKTSFGLGQYRITDE